MKKITTIPACLLVVLVAAATAGPDQEHDHGDDSHSHAATTATAETPVVSVVRWSDRLELGLEYPRLVPNQNGRFLVHLTDLDGFQPVHEGTVTLRFTGEDGQGHGFTVSEPEREGLFAPAVRLPRAGAYDFEVRYRGPAGDQTFVIDGFVVHAAEDEIPPAATHGADEITFLKEQQWKVPFATAEAEVREIKRSVWAIAEVLPAPSAYAEIDMPVDGFVQAVGADDLALPGSQVQQGDIVVRIRPAFEGEGWATSRYAFEQAERNYERARRLRESDAISQREFEEAENAYQVEKARQERFTGGQEGTILDLAAPISGRIIDWRVRPGQRLNAGDHLMAIADPSVVWLQVNVYEQDFRGLGTPSGAFVSGGSGEGWSIPEADLRVLSTGGTLDPVSRTIPVLLEITNTEGRLTINESTPVELYASEGATATAIPRSAVYEDDGLEVVFVQISGETFAKRVVTLGPHHAGWVSVREGLEPGERVVVRGGYHVKLASTTAEIGHGHAH